MAGKKNKIELSNTLSSLVDKVTRNFNVDEVILFGSYAKGEEKDTSDIDVVVISPELDPKKLIYQNVLRIKRDSDILDPYLQLFAFNTDAFYANQFIDPSFIQEIKNTGKSIYKRNSGLNLSCL